MFFDQYFIPMIIIMVMIFLIVAVSLWGNDKFGNGFRVACRKKGNHLQFMSNFQVSSPSLAVLFKSFNDEFNQPKWIFVHIHTNTIFRAACSKNFLNFNTIFMLYILKISQHRYYEFIWNKLEVQYEDEIMKNWTSNAFNS